MTLRRPAPGTFEIGLVMAGAVSAGAYTAGVLDFLYEALAEWEKVKINALSGGAVAPDHKVVIRVCSGASAGGICSALCAMVPLVGHTPLHDPPASSGRTGNLFYDTWVNDVDISHLLTTDDLKDERGVPSVLNGLALDRIAARLVEETRAAIAGADRPKPTWIANPLQLYLSIGNVRGVPYLIQMTAAEPIRGHRTVAHGDYAHFAIRDVGAGMPESPPVGASVVNWPDYREDPQKDGWDYLGSAALSTSAFPLGLPARRFRNPKSLYDSKPWNRLPGTPEDGASPTIAPDLVPGTLEPDYMFWTVDGGVFNNEPLEFARIALSGAPDAHNPREPRKADRAVLMIDPFPEDAGQAAAMGYDKDAMPDLFSLVVHLIGIMKSQSRFKPDELRLAMHEDVHSRFLIAPARERAKGETDIAAAGLGGFAGFLHRSLREHDFFLGRRNCQQFLRNHFVVHRDNPIVKSWADKFAALGKLSEFHPLHRPIPGGPLVPDEEFVQLIPLSGTAAEECKLPSWPRLRFKNDIENRIRNALLQRADRLAEAVVKRLMSMIGMDKGLIANLVGWFAENQLQNLIANRTLSLIEEDLRKRNLLA